MQEQDPLTEHLRRTYGTADGYRRPGPAYFAELAERTIQQAQPQPAPRLRWVKFTGAAAAVLLFLCWAGLRYNPNTQTPPTAAAPPPAWEAQLQEVSEASILGYIEENIQDFEIETLAVAGL